MTVFVHVEQDRVGKLTGMTSFFFSYASHDHASASMHDFQTGQPINLLDVFYDELRQAVASRLGPAADVSYRDTPDLRIGNLWEDSLTDALQDSRSLVALLSPSYLQSENCGRELRFMKERYDLNPGTDHCIIPIFWESNVACNSDWTKRARELIDKIQTTTNMQLPKSYLAQGFKQWMTLIQLGERQLAYSAIADAIVANHAGAQLPTHPNPEPFTELPTMLGAGTLEEQSGPTSAQVFYVVPRQSELEIAGVTSDHHALKRQGWRPFFQSSDTTIAEVTEKGIKDAGVSYQDKGWPRFGLVNRLGEARDDNSVVLFVLDRRALRLTDYAKPMRKYADTDDLPNVGLVTAGGGDVSEADVEDIFGDRFRMRHPNHLWSVAPDHDAFRVDVTSTVNSVKRDLMREGKQPDEHSSSTTPRLINPSGVTS